VNGNHLADLAVETVKLALERGATDGECTISEGSEFSANVRMREVESLKQAGSRAAGLRILVGQHTGSAYTSDLSPEGIGRMVGSAIELASITTADPHAGLPDAAELGAIAEELQLYCPDVEKLETSFKIELARRTIVRALTTTASLPA
jgi:PmbA protein